jgi:hypothetical protein
MRVLLILLALTAPAFSQCPNGNCPTVRVTVTMPAPRAAYAPPPVLYAPPVFLAAPVVPVAYAVPTRTPWYPTKWLRGRRGQ